MKGLILKDLLCLRKGLRSYLFVVATYVVLTVFGAWDVTFFAGFLAVLVSLLPYSCFSYDHAARWETFSLSLPVSRREIVLARYLVALLALAAAAVLILVIGGGLTALSLTDTSWNEYFLGAAVSLCTGVLLMAITLPLLYRFGAERARVILWGVMGVLFLSILLGAKVLTDGGMVLPEAAPSAGLAAVVLLPVCAVLLAVSFLLSVRIYEKRAF